MQKGSWNYSRFSATIPLPPSLQRDRLTTVAAAGAPTAAILTELNSASAESTHCRCCLLASASTPLRDATGRLQTDTSMHNDSREHKVTNMTLHHVARIPAISTERV
jgi:hypothetical protein